mmetsp:Transcript_13276/g.18102  ORF Transcript_13276/g.18102 Transcript_13276/m.18102 type:complete len:258 (-) Transcript_13276:68-841(-)|eukprot:CAMPEP_0201489722 /NCGR_PEP_ID=MMETSP0151_2-20130828/23439_1 /ASSEMBLY_ACC=CAM_ASM_000257 /TAXON_ID=200890 /ORGANISM="Paramoeba atlantica, Strain 621/1 / CCAP 1560/9" /LENGTH=257 /DNA_ID=CAMNT_0047875407 /DNA_START=69 /DNA_END=842 /DNA_ORIENTATION=+
MEGPKIMKKARHHPDVDTAFHLLKGAIVKVLGANLTDSLNFSGATKGKITLVYSGEEAPEQSAIQQIEDLANDKISSAIELTEEMMARPEAEAKYTENPVNNTNIYDKARPRPDIKELPIALIPDWNVNCCCGPHTQPKDLKPIRILNVTHQKGKKKLEFSIVLGDHTLVEKQKGPKQQQKKGGPSGGSKEKREKREDSIQRTTQELILELQKATGAEQSLIESILVPHLSFIKNAAYSEGFQARMAPEEEKKIFFQ